MSGTSGLSRAEGLARIRLYRSAGVGPVTYRHMLENYGSAQDVIAAWPQMAAAAKARGGRALALASHAQVEDEIAAVREAGGRFIFHDGDEYPQLLGLVESGPPVLVAKGRLELAGLQPVALVGARNASAGAAKLAWGWARALAEAGHCVVSGLARGIDRAGHEGALAAGGAAGGGAGTIGVMPGGIDVAYPPEHAGLIERIGAEGLLLSEVPPGTMPTERHFPARNRIIAGLSAVTVVIEAAYKSGSLITARMAADYGREVCAVPGSPSDPRAHGCNMLIREGAILVQRVEDILELITDFTGAARHVAPARPTAPDIAHPTPPPPVPAAPVAPGRALADILRDLLSAAPIAVDDLVRASGADVAAVQMALMELEMRGQLARHAGGRVGRA